jgi:antitoxin HicB
MNEELMSRPYRMELIPDKEEGGFTVYFPELTGCLSCGETREEALANAADAKRVWFEACLEDGIPIPAVE